MGAQSIATMLGMLKKREGYPLEYRKSMNTRIWTISRDAWEDYVSRGGREEGGVDVLMPF